MILGAILAGGRSRRFGTDKAAAEWRGQSLLSHAAQTLAPHCDLVVVSGGRREGTGYATIADWPRNDLGPLGGISGALRHARREHFSRVLTIACDTPVVPASLFTRLLGAGGSAYLRDMPVLGCWPAVLADELAIRLERSSDRSITAWADHVAALPIDLGQALPNVNHREDLYRLDAV